MSYVMSARNVADAGRIVTLSSTLGVGRLNIKPVHIVGRAEADRGNQKLESRQLLEGLSTAIMTWLLVGRQPPLEMDVPPALALYLNRRFSCSFPVASGHEACGGIKRFAYVDLYGNLLPCPAMSFEENNLGGLLKPERGLSLLASDVSDILRSKHFEEFEQTRVRRSHNHEMHPCSSCKFESVCAPCTADLVRGDNGVAAICEAVFDCVDDIPGMRTELFSRNSTAARVSAPRKYLPVVS